MDTLMIVDRDRGAAAVARRVREECAGRRIKYGDLARAIGKSPQAISARISGQVPWDVDELDRACRGTGMSYDYVTAGIKSLSDGMEESVALSRNQIGVNSNTILTHE